MGSIAPWTSEKGVASDVEWKEASNHEWSLLRRVSYDACEMLVYPVVPRELRVKRRRQHPPLPDRNGAPVFEPGNDLHSFARPVHHGRPDKHCPEGRSLDLVELIMALEEEFTDDDNKLEISDEDAEKISTVQHAIDYLKEHGIEDG